MGGIETAPLIVPDAKMDMRYVTLLMGLLCWVHPVSAQVLFSDNFERLELGRDTWAPPVSWKLKENDTRHEALGARVLDVWGGGAGVSRAVFPEEFDYYADFKAMNGGSLGFVFHAQDTLNFYMHEVSTAGGDHTPLHLRWHRKEGGSWSVVATRFADAKKWRQNVWYRVKFEVRKDARFRAYLGKVGMPSEELVFVGEWSDPKRKYQTGKIGFHTWGGNRGAAAHYAQYDNVFITTPEFDSLALEPEAKLAVTWGRLKQ